ncbi:Nif3-like dinuclear metal center hexameric protein [Ignatzschineria ureiclastica]|uniref:GTP cyclohydrolase 1 type 2 homolog n=1 Tax=Ignatzschineria ureiclastica TaxID=472582 RepID=A0A2U2AED6_9GAMM|nr:Nif3-like dinuclear metal center hexameric protein [Ignatzschineria ureiclastica]PWD81032.1 Nif3-like dinuclear metal center hexameric protein [Ignatzschineria ureiclastica]GGZ93114.1 GTP cyclohydrolase 1 type 2 [Ignatzschineria ureiclastica]
MHNLELENILDTFLQSKQIKDYTINGLQVEGRPDVKRIITGVTASLELIDMAIERGADALLVHHGYFWKSEAPAIRGMKYQRIKRLIENGINLYAYHLPLDLEPTLGNNAMLGKLWDIVDIVPLSEAQPLVLTGELPEAMDIVSLAKLIEQSLDRKPFVEASGPKLIKRIAWCSGAAQDMLEEVAEAEFDAFITGEVSERTIYIARELGIHFFAAGHHATERGGVKALGEWLQSEYGQSHGLEVEFIDIDNPI